MNVLLTGGAGYIGTHTAIELLAAGHTVVIIDNFANSSPESIKRVETITDTTIPFYEADVCDKHALGKVFSNHQIDAVIHFAGLKAVGESTEQPLLYYRTNLVSTLSLLESMQHHSITKLIFSSSATVYGTPETLPLTEDSPVGKGLTNPYGKTKYMIEEIIADTSAAWPKLQATILRYFNPVGAHESGLIGEDPAGIPNNLLPFVAQTAVGKRPAVMVFGNDYDTADGTGVRDYIHVTDLARGHVAALEQQQTPLAVYNLGTGKGSSVLEVIAAFEAASQTSIAYTITDRRSGDVAACYASADKAARELGWTAQLTLADACRDSWRWQSHNPDGYRSTSVDTVSMVE